MHIKLGMDIAVRGGINLLVIDAVENAEEAVAARAQEMIKLLAEGRRQNLLGIAFAHRRHGIGKENAPPHNIDNISQFCNLRIQEAISGHPSHFEYAIAKDTLICQIMNGVDGSSIAE